MRKSLSQQHQLATRIRAMASRWQYLPDELAHVLKDAVEHFDEWQTIVEIDEEHHKLCERAGIKPVSE